MVNARAKSKVGVDGYDLVLPSGARAGHREMKVYYKQYTDPRFNDRSYRTVQQAYRAIGLTGAANGATTKQQRRDRNRAQVRHARQWMKLGVKNNKSDMNRHYVEQLLQ